MKKAILATKVGMTQIFNEDGVLTPVTVLQAGPCVVTQVKTVENDGYSAVQVGFTDKREKLVNKAQKGHFNKAGVSYKRYVREFRFEDAESYALAQEIKADIFAAGDKIDATAISKGKGSVSSATTRTLWLAVRQASQCSALVQYRKLWTSLLFLTLLHLRHQYRSSTSSTVSVHHTSTTRSRRWIWKTSVRW